MRPDLTRPEYLDGNIRISETLLFSGLLGTRLGLLGNLVALTFDTLLWSFGVALCFRTPRP